MTTFFLLAFGVAWLCQLPVYAGGLEGPLALGLLALGGIAPTVAAVVATRGAVWRETWRGSRPWWALVVGLVGPSLLIAVGGLATGTLTISGPAWGPMILPPLGEELGWRGFLQPRWRDRFGALGASVGVGAVWALWHLPTAWGRWEEFPLFALGVTAGGVVMGWLWEAAGRSTLAAVALHTGMNLGAVHGASEASAVGWLVCAALAGVALGRRAPAPAEVRAGRTGSASGTR